VIWNKHTTSGGLGAVLVIMVCGIFYEQVGPIRYECTLQIMFRTRYAP